MRVTDWRSKAGFTMIELLVVIAIIGVLAVAVLSSINPLEQIKKGRDTRRRSDAAQLLNAFDRYFATEEEWPWDNSGSSETYETMKPVDSLDVNVLSTQDEIKVGFANRLNNYAAKDQVYVYHDTSANEAVYTCFIAASKAFRDDSCDVTAWSWLGTDCVNYSNGYYICLP